MFDLTLSWKKPDDCRPSNGEKVLIITETRNVYVVPYYDGFNRLGGESCDDATEMTDSVRLWARVPVPMEVMK